jgi:hypothetical protein
MQNNLDKHIREEESNNNVDTSEEHTGNKLRSCEAAYNFR